MAGPGNVTGLLKGLRILELLNLHNGARLHEIVTMSRMPKSTAYRLLENLRRCGYLTKHQGRYYLSLRVRRLSDGFDDTGWISEVARPVLLQLARKVVYPVAIATVLGTHMVLRETTDATSPVIRNRYSRGTLIPLFTSASGKVYLAFCNPPARDTLLEICVDSTDQAHRFAQKPALVEQIVRAVRNQGYAFGRGSQQTQAPVKTSTFAVPVHAGRELIACLALRYIDAALSRDDVVNRYLGLMQTYAGEIGRRVAAVTADSPRGSMK